MNKKRVLSFVMAIVTMLPMFGLTAFAADAKTLFRETFDTGTYTASTEEQLAAGTATKYTMSDGFCYVRDVEGEHNNVAWVPNVYHGSFDRSPTLSYTENEGRLTASADYYINVPSGAEAEDLNFAIRSTGGATFVSDTVNSSGNSVTSGNWPAFASVRSVGDGTYRLYLDTSKSGGWVNANEDIFYASTGVDSVLIEANTWFTIVIDFDLVSGLYILSYRDAERSIVLGEARPCASYSDGGWKLVTGMRNITLNANTLAMGYMLPGFADDNWSNDNADPSLWGKTSVYVDNVEVKHTENAPVIDRDAIHFETFDFGTYTPSTAEGVADKTATKYPMNDAFCYVRDLDGEHENAAWLTNVYHSGFVKSPALSYTVNEGKITASADYYIDVPAGAENENFNFGIRSVGSLTFESDDGRTSGSHLAFASICSAGDGKYRLYLDTSKSGGYLSSNEDIVYAASGVEYVEISANTWFTVVIYMDLSSGLYILTYRDADGETVLGSARPCAMYQDNGWKYTTGIRNLSLSENTFAMGYMLPGFADDNWSNDNADPSLWGKTSVYVDNVRFGKGIAMTPPVAPPPVTVSNDFEQYTAGNTLTAGNDFSQTTPYNKVLSETANGESNTFVRVPFLYSGDTYASYGNDSNYDKSFYLKHTAFDQSNGKYMIYEADFRRNASAENATVQLQLHNFQVEDGDTGETYLGQYLSLFDINLKTGVIRGYDNNMTATGAENMPANEWTRIKFVLDLEDPSYRLYVNGVLYGSYNDMKCMYNDGGWQTLNNPKNIVATGNNLIIAKVNKMDGVDPSPYKKVSDANDTYSNTNYIDIDNIYLETTDTLPLIVLPPVTVSNDFEQYTVGNTLTAGNDFAQTTPYNKVLSETADEESNTFVRVPFLYSGDTYASYGNDSNYDKSFFLKHAAFDQSNGRYMIYEADFRRNASAENATIQLQLHNFQVEDGDTGETYLGQYLSLFDINLQTGVIRGYDNNMTATGAENMPANEWTRIKFVLDLEDPSYRLYVNGVLYGSYDSMKCTYSDGGWKTLNNPKNIVATGNNLIIAKVNKMDSANPSPYKKASDADSTYSNTNYIDIDNIYLETTDTLPPIVLPPVNSTDTFEDYNEGASIKDAPQFSPSNTVYSKMLSETDGNQFVRVPLVYDGTGENKVGTYGYTNYDTSVKPKHGLINADVGKYVVFAMDYRPHWEDTYASNTIEIQLNTFKFDALVENGARSKARSANSYEALTEDLQGASGIFFKLFDINLKTGELSGHTATSLKTTGAAGLKQDEWNRIHLVFNREDTSYSVYVNGALYGTHDASASFVTGSDWTSYTKASNIQIDQNSFIAAKVNKTEGSFALAADADERYSNVNYIDLDNLSLASGTEKDVTVLAPENEEGLALMYVEINGMKVENKNLYLPKDIEYTVAYFDPSTVDYSEIISTETKSSIRLSTPAGLRFATKIIDREALDELFLLKGDVYSDVEMGTLIVPTTYVADIDFTVEALKAVGRKYLTVEASHGHYFSVDNDPATTHYVGSIVNLKASSIERTFAATSYIKITLWGGQEYYYYSGNSHTASVKVIAQAALNDQSRVWGDFDRAILEQYAAGKTIDELIKEDMKNLNVLAFGDSLFGGTIGYDQSTQWVNKLGVDNEWNLTNLGIGSMTVSHTARNNKSEYGDKNSMYDWMFNEKNDFRWNSTSTHTSPNPFFKTGNCTDNKGDVELIILEGGCNDYGTAISAPLGTIDSHDPGTFLGAWNCITERLLEEYPNATIVFLTTWRLPPQTRTDDTLTSVEFSESVITLYNEVYSSNDRIALIDAGNPAVSGVDMLDDDWRTEYSTDSYHLKDTGMAIMADHMLPLLWEIVMKNREAN